MLRAVSQASRILSLCLLLMASSFSIASAQLSLTLQCDFVKVVKSSSTWDGEFNETYNDEFAATAKEIGDVSKVFEMTNTKCEFNGKTYRLTTNQYL